MNYFDVVYDATARKTYLRTNYTILEAALTLSGESSDKALPFALKYNILGSIADSTMEKTVGFTLTYAVPACDCTKLVFVANARRSDITVA